MSNLKIFLLNVTFILWFSFRPASSDQLYIGCFANLPESNSIKSPVQSISQCLNECRNQISLFTAVKDGSSCYCANVTKDRVPSSNCNISCANSDEICGGNNFFSVYTEVPSYQGCFKDENDNRDMDLMITDDWSMTIDKCYEKCLSSKYLFMGVQTGGSCACGQQFGKYGKSPESDCNMTCTGNRSQICGNPGRNSIYSVGYLPALNKSYSEVFHCLSGLTDRYGTCINKTCQPGWKGTKCNQRDCTLRNGTCGQNSSCEKIRVGNPNDFECVCKEGFQSNSIYDECTDVDECQSNPCDVSSETCNNTIGSFNCSCSPGYLDVQLVCGEFMKSHCPVSFNGSRSKCMKATNCEDILNYICPSNEDSSMNKIAGGVVGAILFILLLAVIGIAAYCLFIKRKKNSQYTKYVTKPDTSLQISGSQTNKIIISEVKSYYINHKKDINDQFNKCRKDFGHPQLVACLPENMSKNRFKKMYPYDHNRVNLSDNVDYINASFIQTYGKLTNICFIAAQGPKLETAVDFWRMIWDNNVNIVLMLTRCYEIDKEKCFQYWSDQPGTDMKIGDFVIKTDQEEKRLNYVRRTFKVVRKNEKREVSHFSYISWKDKTIPDNIFCLMNIREKVLSLVDQKSQNNIVVHCSAGVGRTGTFIALDYLIRQAEQEGCVDFYECLNFLRNQRCNMIQAPKQYELCFRFIAMFHAIGKSTFISTADSDAFKSKMENLTDELILKQFDVIEEEVSGIKVYDGNKANIKCNSELLEAVFVPSAEKVSSFVIGRMPDSFEKEDLLNVFDDNASIFILLDGQELKFLPEDHQKLRCRNGSIQLVEILETDYFKKYSLKIDKSSRVSYENTGSPDHDYTNILTNAILLHVMSDVTTSYDVIIRLYSHVKSLLDRKANGVITILSRNGYKDSGFLVAAFNTLQTIDISQEIDVYETVFELRNIQPEIINNIDLFKNLYSFAKHLTNQTRLILNTGLKTMMERYYENSN